MINSVKAIVKKIITVVQLAPQHIHRKNEVEHDIRTLKKYLWWN